MKRSQINLRQKFLRSSSLIMLVFSIVLCSGFYSYMKTVVVNDALEKSELILREVEAIRAYVKDELRPKMYELHDGGEFILEAMSTTYVSMRIMRLFQERKEGYSFRRVSQNPHNPENATNQWEDEMFDWFEADRERLFWQGQVKTEAGSFFTSVLPDYMEKECLRCHGIPGDAPKALLNRYGGVGGFRFSEGDLAGLNSVAIPISKPLSRLATLTGVLFLIIFGSSLLLLVVLNLVFDKLVVSRLARVVDTMDEHGGTFNSGGQPMPENPVDELDSLHDSFRHLNRYVRSARRGDLLQPGFVGRYVVGKPISSGAMTWLYRGENSVGGEKVFLKMPFNNLHVNPLYRACLQTELKLIQHCSHRYLIKVLERIEDTLVLSHFQDARILNFSGKSPEDMLRIFKKIFELTAYLHTMGVVHHDLRPGSFFLTGGDTPVLIDLGLAHWRELPDTIFESGLGPQGDARFMAPEQIRGMRGDARSDLYSLGVMLFQAYTGKFPHAGTPGSMQAWLTAKGEGELILSGRGKTPAELVPFFRKALACDMDERYQWVEDMRDDFQACAGSEVIQLEDA